MKTLPLKKTPLKKTTKMLLTMLLSSAVIPSSLAQNITWGKIQSPQAFQQYWGLTPEQMQQYESYMQIAGKYRHQSSNPLVVLSIIAKDPEDKGFYAAKAAAYEHKMAKAEIESAWLITQEMERQGLVEAMQSFSDELTGVDTQSYIPSEVKTMPWQKNDVALLVINKTCLSVSCIKGFLPILQAAPATVKKVIILRDKQPLNDDVKQWLSQKRPLIEVKRYDPIEHHYLDGILNQAVQIRNSVVIRKF